MKHKHYDMIVAWAEGKQIQVEEMDGTWSDIQEPSWYGHNQYRIKPEPKPEQEPVALKMVYGEVCCQSKHDDQSFGMWCPITEEEFPNGTPFYTAPPRKEWVGLSETEIRGCTCECVDNGTFTMACAIDFARALQTTLKDRNTTN